MLWFEELLRTRSNAFTYVNVPLSLEVFCDASAPVHSSVGCISLYFAVIAHAHASVQSAVFSCQGVRRSLMLDAALFRIKHSFWDVPPTLSCFHCICQPWDQSYLGAGCQ